MQLWPIREYGFPFNIFQKINFVWATSKTIIDVLNTGSLIKVISNKLLKFIPLSV